jgi:hypothetical protein
MLQEVRMELGRVDDQEFRMRWARNPQPSTSTFEDEPQADSYALGDAFQILNVDI